MKKLVAIALVLAMASAASAGIGFVAVGAGPFAPGETVTINLVGTGICNGFAIGAVSDGGDGGVATLPTINANLTVVSAGYLENTAAGILFDTIGCYAGGTGSAAGQILASFQYTIGATPGDSVTIACLASGTPFVDSLGDTYIADPSQGNIGGAQQNIDGVTLSIIPEPMTLGLLGLGGLFLRRRVA